MKTKKWVIGWLAISLAALFVIGFLVIKVDPYFHYHKPDLENYYYSLDNQRSQNDGISKHFDYDALITGTSMTENFKTSEMDEIFGVNSIKVSYSGSSYKEINDNLIVALKNNPNLKTIVRALDRYKLADDKDTMRDDLGSYPTYLYDNDPLNDVKYLFNKDILFGRVYTMMLQRGEEDFTPGITTFDDYSNWQSGFVFGVNSVLPDGVAMNDSSDTYHLTDSDKEFIYENITQNVTSLADEYPDVDFYYFFPPYSVAHWIEIYNYGSINWQVEAEKYAAELILEHPNIHLYLFDERTDIITNLNNYKDQEHYGQWINSLMLRWMKDGKYLLTKENYQDRLYAEMNFYSSFDYASLSGQEDYESDFYAAALLNRELTGAEPLDLLNGEIGDIELSKAEILENQYDGGLGIRCGGSLQREPGAETEVEDYIFRQDYIGAKVEIEDIGEHNYLVFYGKKVTDHGQPLVCVYNSQNECVAKTEMWYIDMDNEWHQYVLDLTAVEGSITVIFNGGYVDNTGSVDSEYIFSGITLY